MRVKDLVTSEVVTVAPGATAKEAFRQMKSLGIRHLVVVAHDQIVGIVTDRDLRRPKVADMFRSWEEAYRISDEFQVEDIMTSPVFTIAADADVKDAAKLMVQHRIGALPVLGADQRLAGVITESDLLRALISSA